MAARAKPRSLYAIFARTSPPPRRRPYPDSIKTAAVQKQTKVPKQNRPAASRFFEDPVMQEKEFPKDIPTEALRFLRRLHDEGFLKNATFVRDGEFDPHNLPRNVYSRNSIKSAAEDFGSKHQEIAKWLSGSYLKKVAQFGCPTVERSTVFAAKRLRMFFKIHENTVCRACKLKTSCKFMNKEVGRVENVILADVMRLLVSYSLDSVSCQLSVPDELKLSVSKLLREALNLSE